MRQATGRRIAASISLFVLATLGSVAPAHAAASPSVRLVVGNNHVTLERTGRLCRYRGSAPRPCGVSLNPGVYVGSTGGAFELRVGRPDYDTPVGITQVDATNPSTVLRTLPADVLAGWYGLKDFLNVKVKNAAGNTIMDQPTLFCPNGYDRERTNDSGPQSSVYPYFCSANPFTKGMVWGIDDGWAVNPLDYYFGGVYLNGPDGDYHVTISINQTYQDLLSIPHSDAVATVVVTLQTVSKVAAAEHSLNAADQAPAAGVPIDTNPDPSTLPDPAALPSWGINVQHVKKTNRDYLDFNATEWNAGPQPLVIEGFRRPNTDIMDAWQYFYSNGQIVGKAPVGTLVYDARPAHEHWHFQQFAGYSLLDSTQTQVVKSRKASFCIFPTDAIDLTVQGAEWSAGYYGGGGGLSSACGYQGSIWTRETMPAGWGDTYGQYLPGQSFNITTLPNGRYYIQVSADPLGLLYETDSTNNVQLRLIKLRGIRGHRRVIVPPWHGIDTEGGTCYPFCFGG